MESEVLTEKRRKEQRGFVDFRTIPVSGGNRFVVLAIDNSAFVRSKDTDALSFFKGGVRTATILRQIPLCCRAALSMDGCRNTARSLQMRWPVQTCALMTIRLFHGWFIGSSQDHLKLFFYLLGCTRLFLFASFSFVCLCVFVVFTVDAYLLH